jgi:type II secretion system protein H
MKQDVGTSRHAGFTLLELVLVLVITGVLAAIALPRFAQASDRQRLSVSAERLMADIALAQSRARAASQTVTVVFDTANDRYTIDAVGGDEVTVQIGQTPYEVDLVSASFNGSSTLQFNGYGVPIATGSIQISTNAGTAEIAVQASGETKR